MKRSRDLCGAAVLCVAVAACTGLPTSRNETGGTAVPGAGSGAAEPDSAQDQADAAEMAQDPLNIPAQPGMRRENLTCYSGTDDRHARIGVALVNNQVAYFAYYSKWRPRTCSIEAGRGDALNRWTDNGSDSTVTLADHKGELRIERKGDAYRFAFFDVDRGRYCGMPGKINGSLTVTRGKSSCVVQGVMDGQAL